MSITVAGSARNCAGYTDRGVGRSRAALLATSLVVAVAASLLFAALARADVRITGESTFPNETTVGDQDIPFRFTVENISTDPDRYRELILEEAGITPACARFVKHWAFTICAEPEPDVFELRKGPAAAVGVAGSCVGDTFSVEGPDTGGSYRIIPEHYEVILGPSDGSGPLPRLCRFEMLIREVTGVPATDVRPAEPGVQTEYQIAAAASEFGTGHLATFTRFRQVTVFSGQLAPPPDTRIDSGPANGSTIAVNTATFGFSSPDDPSATFECSANGGAFGACSGASRHTMSGLSDGAHSFAVRAKNSGGVDPTPASRSFTVQTEAPDTEITGDTLKAKKTQKQGGKRVKVTLRASAAEPVDLLAKGRIKVKGQRKVIKLKPQRRSAEADERVKLVLKPAKRKDNRKVLRALRAGKRATANVSVRFSDAAGNRVVRKARVKLR